MRRFIGIFAILLISGCTISDQGITPFWMQKLTTKPVVVEPKKVVGHEFRCLIIEETANRSALPKTQLAMLTGKNLRDFLKANCVKDSAGNPQFRIVDKETKLTGVWEEMRQKADVSSGYPLLFLQNGDSYLAKPLPTDWAELQMDLEKYAGVTP